MRRSQPRILAIREAACLQIVVLLRFLAFALLFVPIALVIFLSFASDAYTVIPPTSYSWRWYGNLLAQKEFIDSFFVSLAVAAFVTPASLIIGTLAAYSLWKHPSRLGKTFEIALMSPIMLPLVVTGLAMLVFFNRIGFYSSFWNIVISHVVITFPYSVRAVLAVLARYDRQLDEAAASLRVRPWHTFFHVTLPLIRPGLFAGGLFAFVMSFDDFAVTIFLIDPHTRTLPVAIYQYMEWNLDPTVSAVSSLLVLIAVVGALLVEWAIGLDRFVGLRG